MTIVLASDHAGYTYKEEIKKQEKVLELARS